MNLASFTNFFSKHPRRRGPLMISEVDKTVDELAQAGIDRKCGKDQLWVFI
jgi:hypothetical protein